MKRYNLPPDVCRSLQDELRQARQASGLTQAELALKLGMHHQTYVRAETYGVFTRATHVKFERFLRAYRMRKADMPQRKLVIQPMKGTTP